MTAEIDLGNYQIDEDSNGDLVIKDDTGTTIFTWDSTNNKWVMSASAPLDVSELVDGAGVSHTGELEDINHVSKHEAGGSDVLTIGNLLNFDPVEVLIDTQANKPAAGTVDRVFIEQDTGKILRDNGTSYDVIGTSNIADTDHVAADHENGGSLEVDARGLLGAFLTADTEANRPAAGTTGRYYFATDTTSLFYDDGSAWNEVTSPPETHAPTHKDGGADELDAAELAGALGTSGQFLQSDGAAASWVANPNEPGWVEDGNSPFTGSGASSYTYTVSGSYDTVLVLVDTANTSATDGDEIQVNGNTSTSYAFVDNGDTQTTGSSQFKLGGGLGLFPSLMFGRHGDGALAVNARPADANTGLLAYGQNGNVTPPLDSFTVKDGGGTNFPLRARVYGLDI